MGDVPLHQDLTFVDESRYESFGLWCPLVDTDAVNGCLQVIAGSHLAAGEPRASGLSHPYRRAEAPKVTTVPMRAGDVMVFSQKLFHGSPPNRGSGKRIAFGALLVPREAQLYCYYVDDTSPAKMEVFAVDDAFFTRYPYGTRPAGVPRSALLARQPQ
jgi:ectoine hydroxylase-related dioxygenase (phytanoyl-CoA dioxygenase family)